MRRSLLFLAMVACTTWPAVAAASVTTGSSADPVGDAPAPQVDIVNASWSFDDAAGRFTVVVTLAAKPDDENWGVVNANLRRGCDQSPFATLRGTSRTGGAGGSAGTYEDGVQPDGSTGPSMMTATNVKSDEGRTTTIEGSHARLVGRDAGCVTITLSHNGVLDSITLPATARTGTPTPPPATQPGNPGPGPGPGPAPAAPAHPRDVRLGSGRRLRFRKNRTRLGLTGLAAGMRSDLRLRLADGTTIASGRYVARVTQPALVTLTLTQKGRRWLRAHRRGRATLTVRTSLDGAAFQRRYAMRIR